MSTIPDPTILDTPAMFEWAHETTAMHEAISALMKDATMKYKMHSQTLINKYAVPSLGWETTVYIVPVGYKFALTRFVIEAEGFSPANPFAVANTRIFIHKQITRTHDLTFTPPVIGNTVEFLPNPPGTVLAIPAIISRDIGEAGIFNSGEGVTVRIVVGTAQNMTSTIQGYLIEEELFS